MEQKEDEADYTDSFTGDFINEEPVVFKGLTDGEVKTVFLLALFCGAPVGILIALIIGIPELILVFVLLFPIVAVYFIASYMGKARRGKPPGYVEQRFSIKKSDLMGSSSRLFVSETYRWGLGRTKKRVVKK